MPLKYTTRSQRKKRSVIPVDEVEVGVPKENQEQEEAQIKPVKKRGRKKKLPVIEDGPTDDQQNELDPQNTTVSAPKKATKRKTVASAPKKATKRNRKDSIGNDDIIQGQADINERSDEDDNIQEPAATNTSISKLLELSDDDDNLSEVESSQTSRSTRREPLAPITNNNRIHSISNKMITNVRQNTSDGLNNLNEASESFSRLNLNNTPRPPSNANDNRSPSNDRSNDTHRHSPNYRHPNYRSNNTSPNTSPFTSRTIRSNTPNNTSPFTPRNIRSNTPNNIIVRSDNDMFRSNNNTSFRSESTPFHMMDNIHQVCSWLCNNPNVLLLAYNMYLSMQAPVTNEFNFISSNFNSSRISAAAVPQEDKLKGNRDFLEELKCLFLRSRDPEKCAFEELVRGIFKCDLNSDEGIDWLRAASRNFGDFRNKFLDSIDENIDKFNEEREKRGISYTTRPSPNEIRSFVSESVTTDILSRWLNATNLTELRAQNSMYYLRKLVINAINVNYLVRDTEKTKTLDNITRGIAVPSRNGRNIADSLQL